LKKTDLDIDVMKDARLFMGHFFWEILFSVMALVTMESPWLEFRAGFRFGGNWLAGSRSGDPFR
jgi:hypothetical protein